LVLRVSDPPPQAVSRRVVAAIRADRIGTLQFVAALAAKTGDRTPGAVAQETRSPAVDQARHVER
jgi:hypothetical protein